MKEHPREVSLSGNVETLRYAAPEVFCYGPVSSAVDVYGLGVLIWELVTLDIAFYGYTRADHFEKVVCNHERRAGTRCPP